MTFDEYIRLGRAGGGGTKTDLHHATGVSLPTLRRVEGRQPIRFDVAQKLAAYLIKIDPQYRGAASPSLTLKRELAEYKLAASMAAPKPRRATKRAPRKKPRNA